MKEIEIKSAMLMDKAEVVTLSSISENGYPRNVPISKIKNEGISAFWFATGVYCEKVKHYSKNPKASISYNDNTNSVILSGDIEIINDEQTKKDLWQDWFINHFPEGQTDPTYCILKFTTKYSTLWIDNEFERFEY